MQEAIGQLLPLGIVVGLSPIPIIAVVLMLSTPRAHSNGPAFLLGWIVGLVLVGTLVLLLAGGADASDDGGPATWVSVVKIVLGGLVLLLGVKAWRGRPRGEAQAELPGWMQAIDTYRAPKALAIGVLLSGLNPKNLVLTAAAAAGIAQTGIDGGEQAIALAVFVLLGTLGVGVPVALYLAMGERSRELLSRVRSWMAANNAVITAVLMLVIGAKIVGDGISGL
jgi:threonine/homoserine/homoserine lactone efflux protein